MATEMTEKEEVMLTSLCRVDNSRDRDGQH